MAREIDYAGGKKQPKSRLGRICRAIYNKDKGELFGRNCSSWAKIFAFYTVYYCCLAGFFAAYMFGFFQTIDETKPTMTGMYSPMKYNPGVGFRPQPNYESTLIKFNSKDVTTYMDDVDNILSYLKENGYINEDNKPSDVTQDSEGKDVFSIESLDPECSIDYADLNESFGYSKGQPCILLKINKVFGWEPKAFDNDSLSTDHGKAARAALGGTTDEGGRLSFSDVGVSCEGENDADLDFLGPVSYYPPNGFSFNYFPYVNAKNYRSPLVFIKFNNVKPGTLLQIWCKIWTKNVYHHKNDKAGSVRFELLMDNKLKKN